MMIKVKATIVALPYAVFAGIFFTTWFWPHALGELMVRHLLLVMLLEFIIIHSSAFMGNVLISKAKKKGMLVALLGFGFFYSLFAGAFALAFKRWWPLLVFWGLTLNKLLGVIIGGRPTKREAALMTTSWAASVAFYLLSIMVTTFLPMPRFGITRDVVRGQDLPGEGEWIDHPEKVIAAGLIYFTALAITNFLAYVKVYSIKTKTEVVEEELAAELVQ